MATRATDETTVLATKGSCGARGRVYTMNDHGKLDLLDRTDMKIMKIMKIEQNLEGVHIIVTSLLLQKSTLTVSVKVKLQKKNQKKHC